MYYNEIKQDVKFSEVTILFQDLNNNDKFIIFIIH